MTARSYEEREIPTFLTDQEQYDFIRNLWAEGRVFPIRGDLTADTTMVDIANTLERLGLDLGLLYPSNAEQYFDFTPEFRRNIIVQPFDENSLLIRTRPMQILGYPEDEEGERDGDYHYNIQGAKNFAQWMEMSRIRNSARLLIRHHEETDTPGLSIIRRQPQASDTPPRVAGMGGEAE